jgi:predicted NBD/HSP70 family sugar kinase
MAGEAGRPRLLRAINDRAVLDLLLAEGPMSRPRLGEVTGLSKPTMSQILARLEGSDLVIRSGNLAGKPGPNAQLYQVNPAAAYVAGLDVTPSRMRAAVADVTGRILGEYELPTPGRSASETVSRVCRALEGALAGAGLQRADLDRVTIATPGAFDPGTQRLRYARHLPGWHAPELLDDLRVALGLDLEVDNDVNLAAIAEQHVGVAIGHDDFVLLWVEEGVGAAVVLNGRLHRGTTGGAGEVGFLPVPGTPLVRKVGVNNAGGFQEVAGAKAVKALAREHGVRGATAEAAVAAAVGIPGRGDRLVGELGHRLAVGIAAIVSVVDPGLVVLTGGIANAGGDRLLDAVRAEVADLAVVRPQIALSAVPDRPVLRGALLAALQTTRDVVFNTNSSSASADRGSATEE